MCVMYTYNRDNVYDNDLNDNIYLILYLIDDNFANKITNYSDLLKSKSRRKICRVIHLNFNRQIYIYIFKKFAILPKTFQIKIVWYGGRRMMIPSLFYIIQFLFGMFLVKLQIFW